MAWGTPVAASQSVVASGDITVTLPANSSGDILGMWAMAKDFATPSASGWTFYEIFGASNLSGWLGLKDARSTGSESGPTVTRSGTTNLCIALGFAVSGGIASGDASDVTPASSTETSGTSTLPSIDPVTDDCLIMYGLGADNEDGLTSGFFTTPDGTGPTFTELAEGFSTSGTDGSLALGYGEHSGNAATGTRSVTRAIGSRIVHMVWALKPAVGGGGGVTPLSVGRSLPVVGAGR